MINKTDESGDFFHLLEKTIRLYKQFMLREFSKKGLEISAEQLTVLILSKDNPGISQKELAKSAFKDPASVTRMVDLLEMRKFVKRETDSNDRRSFGVFLTETGEIFLQEALPLYREIQKFGLKDLTAKDKSLLTGQLKKINENFES